MVARYENDEKLAVKSVENAIAVEMNEYEIMPNIQNFNAEILLRLYKESPQVKRALEQGAEHISMSM